MASHSAIKAVEGEGLHNFSLWRHTSSQTTTTHVEALLPRTWPNIAQWRKVENNCFLSLCFCEAFTFFDVFSPLCFSFNYISLISTSEPFFSCHIFSPLSSLKEREWERCDGLAGCLCETSASINTFWQSSRSEDRQTQEKKLEKSKLHSGLKMSSRLLHL